MNKQQIIDKINSMSKNSAVENLGIIITDFGDKYICGKMPVDKRTIQPYGLLHGGASVLLAESLGSIAGNMAVDMDKQTVVGVEVNANHIKPARNGWVNGKATAISLGKRFQVWKIQITNENNELICDSRLTLAVIKK